MGKVEYFTEPDKYFRHINEPGRIVSAINIVSDTMVSVTSTFEDEFVDILQNTNPVIGEALMYYWNKRYMLIQTLFSSFYDVASPIETLLVHRSLGRSRVVFRHW